jgi:ParB family chromosome partitioning protein
MRPPKLIETRPVALADITIADRLRPVSDLAVQSLAQSIETLGLQNEIHLRKVKRGGALRLIAGGHRVAAYKLLERESIPAKIWDCTDDWAALTEIDDNLAHAELDALELAVFLAKRKEVYERAFPESKRGALGNLASRGALTDNMAVSSFAASTASKMGTSERTVFRLLAAGQALGPREINELRTAPKKVTLADLQEIAKCDGPTARYDICRELAAGTAKSAAEVLKRQKAPGAAVIDPVEQALNKLLDAWARAPKESRRRFATDQRDALLDLLDTAPVNDDAGNGEVLQFNPARKA